MTEITQDGPAASPAIRTGGRLLPFRVRALYASGDMVDGTLNYAVLIFLFYYLTAVCGLSGSLTGLILAVSIVIDAVADPLIGSITDNTRSRLGRRLPYMLVSGPPAALAFAMMFSVPASATGWVLVAYAAFWLLVLRFSLSFYILPFSALGAELSADYRERSVVFAYRVFFNCVGNIVVLALGYLVFMAGRDGLLDREGYAGFGWTTAAVALVAALIPAVAMLPERWRLRAVTQSAPIGLRNLGRELAEVFRNPSFRLLFLCCLLFWTAIGFGGTLAIHANLYFWQLPSGIIALLPFLQIAGYVVGLPLATWLSARYEKRSVAFIGIALAAAAQFIPPLLFIAGLLPSGDLLYAILGAFSFAGGAAGSSTFVPLGSMMSDAVDEHELLFGSRREGMYFAGLLLSIKAAAGVGGMLAGLSLDLIGFPQDIAATDPASIPAGVIVSLGLVQGPLAALIGGAGALFLINYRITAAELARIQSALGHGDPHPAPDTGAVRP